MINEFVSKKYLQNYRQPFQDRVKKEPYTRTSHWQIKTTAQQYTIW